jgi:hypothetical protein
MQNPSKYISFSWKCYNIYPYRKIYAMLMLIILQGVEIYEK